MKLPEYFHTAQIKNLFFTGSSIVLLVCLVAVGMLYFNAKRMLQNPTEAAAQEKHSLLSRLSAFMVLPDEDPTLATVSDKSRLSGQAFFSKAENGDKVLLFTKSKKAILYRPSLNKIIEVAPITVSDSKTNETVNFQNIKVAIYNGTSIPGYASITEKELKANIPTINVVEKGNSVSSYSKTIVIDISGGHEAFIANVTKYLNGQSSPLPDGEKKPSADVLIIVGK